MKWHPKGGDQTSLLGDPRLVKPLRQGLGPEGASQVGRACDPAGGVKGGCL